MNALFFALVAALGNLAGGYAVVRHERRSLAVIDGFLAFGAGFMLSVALLEVAPEAIERDTSAPIFLLADTSRCTSPNTYWCRISTSERRPTRSALARV